jgi:hypothetical protein
MTTPDNTEQPNEEVQELTDDNLEEVSGGGNVFGQLATDSCTATYDVWLQETSPTPAFSDLL